jgi:hypothetical protein
MTSSAVRPVRWGGSAHPTRAEDERRKQQTAARSRDPFAQMKKIICLTDAGSQAMRVARDAIAEIEAGYAEVVGGERFEAAAQTLNALLHGLTRDTD